MATGCKGMPTVSMQGLFLLVACGLVTYSSAGQLSHEVTRKLQSRATAATIGDRRPFSGFEQQWQQCGTWQDDYTALHNDILTGNAAQMFLIAEPPAGLADSLACIGTLLYVSILTNRAFLIRDAGGLKSVLRFGYEQSHIQWAADPDALELLPRVRIENLSSGGGPPTGDVPDMLRMTEAEGITIHLNTTLKPSSRLTFSHWESDHVSFCRHGDLRLLAKEANIAEFGECNGGMIHDLFRNPRYSRQLHSMGVRPETAFSCAFWFLFSPTESVRSRFAKVESALAHSNSINIGIQIRAFYTTSDNFTAVEDSVLACEDIGEARAKIDAFAEYFTCAELIEHTLRKEFHINNVRWFLVSDSAKIRNCAAIAYQDKMIGHRHQERQLEHIRVNRDPADAVIETVGDQLMLAMTDFVVSKYGSYGKMAALIHGRWHSYYRIPPWSESNEARLKEVCSNPLAFDEMVLVPPGV